MSFIYSLIARESNIVLADYTEYSGNFEQVARIVLQKGIKHNCKYIINYDKYKMHYINENNLTFLCITDQVSDDTAFAFLSEIKLELLKMYSFEQLQEFYAYQLKKGIDLLNKYMIYYNTNPSDCKLYFGNLHRKFTIYKMYMNFPEKCGIITYSIQPQIKERSSCNTDNWETRGFRSAP